MNSRPSYDSETARRVDLEFVCVFGHECVHRRLACSVGDNSTGASAIKCWWLMRNLFGCYSLSMISRDAVLSAMLAGLTRRVQKYKRTQDQGAGTFRMRGV